jgi:predicted DNA-binding WGR domain protein
MIRYFENKTENMFWKIELSPEDSDMLVIRSGKLGTEGDLSVIADVSLEREMPADVLFDKMVKETRTKKGFAEVLVDNLLEHIERGHNIKLRGRLKRFYDDAEYKQYQGKTCPVFECEVDFASAYAQGYFDQEYYNREDARMQLIPILICLFLPFFPFIYFFFSIFPIPFFLTY